MIDFHSEAAAPLKSDFVGRQLVVDCLKRNFGHKFSVVILLATGMALLPTMAFAFDGEPSAPLPPLGIGAASWAAASVVGFGGRWLRNRRRNRADTQKD